MTDPVDAVETLRITQRRLAETQALARTGTWELDIVSGTLWWSDETYRIFEVGRSNLVPSYEAFLALVHPDDREAVNRAYTRSVEMRQPYDIVHRLITVGGRVRHLRELCSTDYDADGRPIRSYGVTQDVTEQVEAEARAEAAERRFGALIEHSTDLIAILGTDRRIRFANPAFGVILGHRPETWVGRDLSEIIWPSDVANVLGLFAVVVDGPGVVVRWRFRVRHQDGGFRWLEGTAVNHSGDPLLDGIVVNCRDVTERVRLEIARRESEERLRQAISVARVGIFDHDQVMNTIYWSPRQREIFGFTPDEPITLEKFLTHVHPDDLPRIASAVQSAHDPRGDGKWDVEHRIIRRDGAVRWLTARSQTFFEGEGESRHPVRTIGAVTDVTEEREARDEMRVRGAALEDALNGMAITDHEGRINYANPAFARMWGFDDATALHGLTPMDLGEPTETAAILEALRERGTHQGEVMVRHRDGHLFPALISATVVRDATGQVMSMIASFFDLSEHKRLQAQLLQAQKMESVGRLAGGIAHDFNNMLTVINGYLELALGRIDERDPVREVLAPVATAAQSAAQLTKQLLAFSRRQVIQPEVLQLAEVIERVQRMLTRLLGEDIELQVSCAPDTGRVRFDRSQCEQIMVNLAVNARDAMPEGGVLAIETMNVQLDEEYADGHPSVTPGEYVLLAISDTGSGMTEEVRAHLFEPFFTTKGPGRGTGLGLPMVFGAVSQNGGRIEVYSELGSGSTFKIYLPRADEPPSAVAKRTTAAATAVATGAATGAATGGETVFVVEDDDGVRGFASAVLAQCGYRVQAFRNGAEALRAASAPADSPHLLVTDLVMPGMNGRVLSERLQALYPQLRVLFTSGYAENLIVQDGRLEPGVAFLPKPYSVHALLQRVREVLEDPPAQRP